MKCFEGQIGRGGLTIEKVKEELQEVEGGERRRGSGRPTAHDEGTASSSVYMD